MSQTDNKTAANPPAGGAGDQSKDTDLASLLESYDSGNQRTDGANPVAVVLEKLAPVVQYVEADRKQKAESEIAAEIDRAVAFMTEPDEVKHLPRRVTVGYLDAFAREHPEINEAFRNRAANPKGLQDLLAKAREEYLRDLGSKPGPRDDVAAALATVRGTNNAPPASGKLDPKVFRDMTDQQFEAFKARLGAA